MRKQQHLSRSAGLVKERPLDQWKETLAVLCSHSNLDEFQGLCDALARRLSNGGLAHAATLCWICAAKVDQALHVWAKELLSKQASVAELQVSILKDVTELGEMDKKEVKQNETI